MKSLAVVLLLIAAVAIGVGQYQGVEAVLVENETDISLSIHFLDGLSAASSDGLPEIRFHQGGCDLSLLLTNTSTETVTLWKPYCPEGDAAIRLEFKRIVESKTIGIAKTSHLYTGGMGIAKTFSLVPDDSLVYHIDLSSYWLIPFGLKDGEHATGFVRAVYESSKLDSKDALVPDIGTNVWVGKVATKWQKVKLSNMSGKRIGPVGKTNILATSSSGNAR